jgi:hypothetical protein
MKGIMRQNISCAILQSCFIPWIGYFHIIDKVDHFIFLDDVQYTKRDWRNRNRILSNSGVSWLTIPVLSKGRFSQTIQETLFVNSEWKYFFINSIKHTYSGSPFYEEIFALVSNAIKESDIRNLSELNIGLIKSICKYLGISTEFHLSSDFKARKDKNLRLIDICSSIGANIYFSGPSAKDYIDEKIFSSNKISINFIEYPSFIKYKQFNSQDFKENLSILDVLFNLGSSTKDLLHPESHRFLPQIEI